MEQLATDAIKSYPGVAIPLVCIALLVYWVLAHLRWIEENRNKQMTEFTAVCNRNAETVSRNTETLGRVLATLDRLDAQRSKT